MRSVCMTTCKTMLSKTFSQQVVSSNLQGSEFLDKINTIIGGYQSPFPHSRIIINRTSIPNSGGTGTAISSRWILTAAHVVINKFTGEPALPSTIDSPLMGNATRVIVHPEYRWGAGGVTVAPYDFALIRMTEPVDIRRSAVGFELPKTEGPFLDLLEDEGLLLVFPELRRPDQMEGETVRIEGLSGGRLSFGYWQVDSEYWSSDGEALFFAPESTTGPRIDRGDSGGGVMTFKIQTSSYTCSPIWPSAIVSVNSGRPYGTENIRTNLISTIWDWVLSMVPASERQLVIERPRRRRTKYAPPRGIPPITAP